ncbi:dicarboxylate/amino acid:cation symporter [Agarilytica rhodophyticola]|uniref:dicarboxylate/amino acid:cation symporter n=1 Tax=Agarilytica rhodophyticola TaxID=1737490 RepID=UPI000B348173|nr:dicarboxylate/amino acid:cation symporter [Agarilytica rhodophyticola]
MTDHNDVSQGLTKRILIAMGLGAVVGLIFFNLPNEGLLGNINSFLLGGVFDLVGSVFIASLKMLVVPLVFVSLVCGVCSIGGNSRIGMISVKTIAFYLITTAVAISLALALANIIDPGVGNINVDPAKAFEPKESPSIWATLKDLVPTNIVSAMADGKMLQIIIFAILFGIGLSKVGDGARQVRNFFTELDKVVMQMVLLLMRLAPYGVFCLIATMFAKSGLANIVQLAKYFTNVLLVLIIHMFLSYGTLLWLFTGLNPVTFFKKMKNVWVFGFSTASSNATLPVTLENAEKNLGVKNEIASFTVPLGATINMDGTAIMQGVATVFISQYFNIDIGFTGYMMVILTATLASIGTAGVPGVGLIMLTMVLAQVGLPAEGIAIIIGVDRILDMARTAVNITGDSAASIIVAKSEDKLDIDTYNKV